MLTMQLMLFVIITSLKMSWELNYYYSTALKLSEGFNRELGGGWARTRSSIKVLFKKSEIPATFPSHDNQNSTFERILKVDIKEASELKGFNLVSNWKWLSDESYIWSSFITEKNSITHIALDFSQTWKILRRLLY